MEETPCPKFPGITSFMLKTCNYTAGSPLWYKWFWYKKYKNSNSAGGLIIREKGDATWSAWWSCFSSATMGSSPRSQQLCLAKSREAQKLGRVQHLIILRILYAHVYLQLKFCTLTFLLFVQCCYWVYSTLSILNRLNSYFVFIKIIPKYFMLYWKRTAISLKES